MEITGNFWRYLCDFISWLKLFLVIFREPLHQGKVHLLKRKHKEFSKPLSRQKQKSLPHQCLAEPYLQSQQEKQTKLK